MAATGARNLITDVAGLTVGHAHDRTLASGVTVVLMDSSAVAAASVFGGGPGTRELDAIGLEGSVGVADAIVLSGGSAFGLDAATGVQSFLREQGRGFQVGTARVPIVPQAILFDLLNGGDKGWGRHPPYRDMAYEAGFCRGRIWGNCGRRPRETHAGRPRKCIGDTYRFLSPRDRGHSRRCIGGGQCGRSRQRCGYPSFLGRTI